MVRSRSVKEFDLLDTLGDVALVVIVIAFLAGAAACALVIKAAEALHDRRWLGPLLVAALLIAGVLLTGCSTAPAPTPGVREPEVFRPVNPSYPLPR